MGILKHPVTGDHFYDAKQRNASGHIATIPEEQIVYTLNKQMIKYS